LALARLSLPELVRGSVRGGTSSTTQFMPVIERTLSRIWSCRRRRVSSRILGPVELRPRRLAERTPAGRILETRRPAGRLASGHVLVETKSEKGNGVADRLLRAAGARAVDCSKYCVGIALSRPDMKHNELKWLLARYFDWSSPLATAGDGAEAQPAARANVAALGPDGRLRLQPVRLPG
jgi:hypothetical protein